MYKRIMNSIADCCNIFTGKNTVRSRGTSPRAKGFRDRLTLSSWSVGKSRIKTRNLEHRVSRKKIDQDIAVQGFVGVICSTFYRSCTFYSLLKASCVHLPRGPLETFTRLHALPSSAAYAVQHANRMNTSSFIKIYSFFFYYFCRARLRNTNKIFQFSHFSSASTRVLPAAGYTFTTPDFYDY